MNHTTSLAKVFLSASQSDADQKPSASEEENHITFLDLGLLSTLRLFHKYDESNKRITERQKCILNFGTSIITRSPQALIITQAFKLKCQRVSCLH